MPARRPEVWPPLQPIYPHATYPAVHPVYPLGGLTVRRALPSRNVCRFRATAQRMIDCLMQILPLKSPATASSVAELAQRRLRESPYYFLKQIRCEYRAGVLTLRGTVPMWQLRQFAEAIVARVEGVRSIENEVEVFDPLSEPIAVRAARSA